MAKTYYIMTMGCQMNKYDSDFLAQSLIQEGFVSSPDPAAADLIIVNTCTVRVKAEQKAMSALGRMSTIKKRRPQVILGVVGCVAQHQGNRLLKRFPLLDFVLGPRELGQLGVALERLHGTGEKVVATCLDAPLPLATVSDYSVENDVTGFISIMQGCNNFCSYCIVPYVRGREACRDPHSILLEAEKRLSQGIREITLLGQNVNSYRWEGRETWDFPRLLGEVSRLPGLLRLRFTTSHPKDLSERLIASFEELETLCPHIHLPFQSGSDRILRAMRRGYTRDRYLGLVNALRAVRPNIAITADVMVGFPGETGEDFQATLDLMEKVEFDSLFSFKYSDRKGTVAAQLEDKVPEPEKASRLNALQTLQRRITLKKNKQLEGTTVEVLVDGKSKRGEQLTGRTATNKVVNFNGNINIIGSLCHVFIELSFVNSLRGQLRLNSRQAFSL